MKLKNLFFPDTWLAKLCIQFLRWYQSSISPDHGAARTAQPLQGCKFYPSCSEYAIQTFQKHGFLFGMPKILWRLLRCHPWSEGGVDKV